MDCYVSLRQKAAKRNMVMETSDILPPGQADIVVFMDHPSPKHLQACKRANPNTKILLVLLETSLGAAYTFNPKNHEDADAVLTYKRSLVDYKKYFPMRPRAYDPSRIRSGKEFAKRKVACLVGTNRQYRFRSGLFLKRYGWQISIWDRIDYMLCPGELMTYRAKVARLCASYPPDLFDIYGAGWELYPETRDRCLGVPRISSLEYLGNYRYYFAFENHRGEESLISERIWDSLWGDSVPVYYGNARVSEIIPKDCFIDASIFSSPAELLNYLIRSPESEWKRLHEAGREFLNSDTVGPFLPEACAEEMMRPFIALTGG
jgi:hypothetical protein